MPSLRQNRAASSIAVVCLAAAMLSFCAGSVFAFEIVGRVVNGTTQEGVGDMTIKIVNPSGGMLVEKEIHTIDDQGHFRAEGLSPNAPVYLLRVDYKGANYTQMVQPSGGEANVEVTVYEPTVSWAHVHVGLPHVIVDRSNDTLSVQKFYQIENHTTPPKTVWGADAEFEFYIPDDALGVNIQVQALGMPLPVSPIPTDEPGFYKMNYPIRPGETRVSMTIALPYGDNTYNYIDKFKYDVGDMTIVTGDPSFRVTSRTMELERIEDFHGFQAFKATDQGPEQALELTIAGGASSSSSSMSMSSSSGNGARPQIHIVQSPSFTISLIMMVFVALVMILMLFATAGRVTPGELERKMIKERKDALLDQLARLDDLHKMGAVSDTIYKLKREELVNSLAQVYYHLQVTTKKTRHTEDPARV